MTSIVKQRWVNKSGLPTLPPDIENNACNGAKHDGSGYCKLPLGWGTNHIGEGRCRKHGGNNGRPNRYGIRKNATPKGLLKRIAYYLEGEGRDKLADVYRQMAKAEALWDYVTEEATDDEIRENLRNLTYLAAETTRILHNERKLQIEGALALDEWTKRTKLINAEWKEAVSTYLIRQRAMSRPEADEALEEIAAIGRQLWQKRQQQAKK